MTTEQWTEVLRWVLGIGIPGLFGWAGMMVQKVRTERNSERSDIHRRLREADSALSALKAEAAGFTERIRYMERDLEETRSDLARAEAALDAVRSSERKLQVQLSRMETCFFLMRNYAAELAQRLRDANQPVPPEPGLPPEAPSVA